MSRFDPDHAYSIYYAEGPGGRGYVGCTSHTVQARWEGHTTHHRVTEPPERWLIGDALAWFGKDAFTIQHIASAKGALNAKAMEEAAILDWGTLRPNGYNSRVRRGLQANKPVKRVRRDIIYIKTVPCQYWPPQLGA